MQLLSDIFLYICIWSVVIFMVLPWGVEVEENPQVGHADSAPKNARIPLKLLVTSILSLIALWLFNYVASLNLIDLTSLE